MCLCLLKIKGMFKSCLLTHTDPNKQSISVSVFLTRCYLSCRSVHVTVRACVTLCQVMQRASSVAVELRALLSPHILITQE